MRKEGVEKPEKVKSDSDLPGENTISKDVFTRVKTKRINWT